MDDMLANGFRAVVDLASAATSQPRKGGDGAERLIVPEGYRVERIDPVDKRLGTVRQAPEFTEVESFVAYVNRFKTPETLIFADLDKRLVTAVFDYHKPPAGEERATADYTLHRAAYTAKLAEEWVRWTSIDGKLIGQSSFAEFVEENLIDVRAPDGASILETVTQLKAKKKVEFQSGIQLQNGTVNLVYKEEIDSTGRGELAIPSEIKLGVPIFYGGPKYEVRVFLRYRIDDGKLGFKVDLHRRRYLEQDAFSEFVKAIGAGTDLIPLSGRLA